MILRDVTRLVFAGGCRARAGRANRHHTRQRPAVAQRVERRHAVVVHVPAAVVLNLGHGVVADVPVLRLQPHRVPNRTIDARDRAAHRVAVVVELADRIGEGQTVPIHRRRLPAGDVIPVKHRPALFFVGLPTGRDAPNHARHVRIIRRGVRDHFQVVNGRPRHGARSGQQCRGRATDENCFQIQDAVEFPVTDRSGNELSDKARVT